MGCSVLATLWTVGVGVAVSSGRECLGGCVKPVELSSMRPRVGV